MEQQIEQVYVPKLGYVYLELRVQTFADYTCQVIAAKSIPSEGFTLKYQPQNLYLAIGCSNGTKMLYSNSQNKVTSQVQCPDQTPTTCVKWRPNIGSTSKVLGVTNADGHFQYWHAPSMKKLFTITQKENSIHCCDFSKSGQHFATAGKDSNIRIYDQNTKSISTMLGAAQWNYRGHSNRVFSVKFIDDNSLVSGGWDSVIHVWDIRQAKSVKAFYGPHVAGDSIDIHDNSLLIGCYAAKDQLQFWDMRTWQQTESITWTGQDKEKVAYVYSACFSQLNKGMVLAGACGVNQVKLFYEENTKHKTACRLYDLKHGCFSVDLSVRKKEFAFTTAHQGLYIYKFDKS